MIPSSLNHRSSFQTLVSLFGAFALALCGLPGPAEAQLSTAEHLAKPGYWPTQVNKSTEEFVGSAVCAKCHTQIAKSQETTQLARTLSKAAASEPLRLHPSMRFSSGRCIYEIKTSSSASTYSVTDGDHMLSAPMIWARRWSGGAIVSVRTRGTLV